MRECMPVRVTREGAMLQHRSRGRPRRPQSRPPSSSLLRLSVCCTSCSTWARSTAGAIALSDAMDGTTRVAPSGSVWYA